ncbi:Glucosidase 2 subunit beta [Halotydeus destructor]|nr:Glucosidase 2 subunit beta [Halotydeus destructor]
MQLIMCLKLALVSILLTVITSDVASSTSEVVRPRGVPLQRRQYYDATKDFSCIDGSGLFPFRFVNDDYCDCADGSDEPGTAACQNGVFNCANVGYFDKNIPSSRVNDGLCDCCDGSDEYNSSGRCQNNCMELGAAAREEQVRMKHLIEKGSQIRNQYIQQAAQRMLEDRQQLEQLKLKLVEAEALKKEKDAIKKGAEDKEKVALDKWRQKEDIAKQEREEEELAKNAERDRAEAEAAFKVLDADKDGILKYYELQIRTKLDKNGDGYVSEEEAKFFLHAKDEMSLEEFIETGWVIMKPYYTRSTAKPSVLPEQDENPEPSEFEAATDADAEKEPHEILDDGTDYTVPEPLPDEELPIDHPDEEDEDEDEGKPYFPDSSDSSTPSPIDVSTEYDDETREIVELAKKAREDFKEVDTKFNDVNSKLLEVEQRLNTDFGPDGAFLALQGQCFEHTDREYVYKLCPFDRSSQRGKDGGGEVHLGRWGKWSGPEGDLYSKMKYDSGTTCWNGPPRSVDVTVRCGTENQVVGASEPNRCEYALDFETPAMCVARNFGSPEEAGNHDEL